MKTVFLIRHGQTGFSLNNKLCSRADEPLNNNGIHEIKRLTAFLNTRNKPDIIITSPLIRAKQTAEIIANNYNIIPIESKELREIDFGDWEGLTFNEIKNKQPDEFIKWMKHPDKFTPTNGESIIDLNKRINSLMNKVINNSEKNSTIYLITHGGPIRSVLINALKIPPSLYWNIKIPHGSVTCLEYDNNLVKLCFLGQIVLLSK